MSAFKKYGYIGVGAVILIFGIIFVPKIADRLQSGTVVEKDRISGPPVEFVELSGERHLPDDLSGHDTEPTVPPGGICG